MKHIYCLIITVIFSAYSYAQQNGNYRTNPASPPNMNWETASDWEVYNGSWQTATVPPDYNNSTGITIRSGHYVSVNTDLTIDQAVVESTATIDISGNVQLTLRNNTELEDMVNNGTILLNDFFGFFGSTFTINGRLVNIGEVTINNPVISIMTVYGTYEHRRNGGTIPTATWWQTSFCIVTGTTNAAPTGLGQNFGNFWWNTPGMGFSLVPLNIGTSMSTQNNFEVSNTGAGIIALTTLTGNVLNINGNFLINGSSNLYFTPAGSITINVNSDFVKAGSGICYFTQTGTANLNVNGNVSHTSGILGNSGPGTANLNFSGTSLQTYTGGGTVNGALNYIINSGAIVDLGTGFLSGGGSFTLNANGTLRTGNLEGIESGTASGAIRVLGSKTFQSNGNLVYNGTGAQNMGNLPEVYSSGLNIIVNKPSGDLTMESGLTIDNFRSLNLNSGNLIIGANNTLALNGTITGTGSLTAGSAIPTTSSLSFNGSGTIGTIRFTPGNHFVNTLTYTNGNVSLASPMNVSGDFIHAGGILDLGGQELTIISNYTNSGGTFQSAAASNLLILGSGSFNNLIMEAGSTLNTMEINRAGVTVTTSSDFSVSFLRLLGGTLTAFPSMQIVTSITRNATGILSNVPGGTGTYSVIYQGNTNFSTGNELPNLATRLINLTKNGSSNVNLSKSITVNGDVNLNGGTLGGAANNITMLGPNWNFNGGALSPLTVTFNATSTIGGTSSDIQFHNLVMNASAIVAFPAASDLVMTGNLTILNAATLAVQPQSFYFIGGNNQTISVNNKALNSIVVDKTAGDVTLQSSLRLRQKLEMLSGTGFYSQGNLTLISNSAGTTGNAYIATLPSGATIDGDVTVQRLVDPEGKPVWRHITSPVSGATLADLSAYFNTSDAQGVYSYDETQPGTLDDGWVKEPLTTVMTPGKGFIAAAFNSTNNLRWQMTGPVNQGIYDFEPTKSGNTTDDGWNLTGNPYPSTIDWDAPGWTKTRVSGTFYVRDYINNIYLFWTGNPATSTKSNSLIATGQGFWIIATQNGNPPRLLGFTEAVKSTSTGTFYRKATPEIDNYLAAGISDGTKSDKVFIVFDEKGNDNYDELLDARKLSNEVFNISTISKDNFNLCVDYKPALSEEDISVFLNVYNFETGNYTLFFEKLESINPEFQIYLIDHYTDEYYNLRDIKEIQFSVNPNIESTFGKQRFEVLLTKEFSPDFLSNSENLQVYPNPAKDWITVRFKDVTENDFDDDIKYNIFDPLSRALLLNGVLISEGKSHHIANIEVSKLKTGMYIIQVEAGNQSYFSKLLIE